MWVVVRASDAGRCGNRLIWPAEQLRAQGADIDVIDPDGDGSELRPGRPDVIVLQRPMHTHWVQPLRRAQAAGTTIVVDIDDNFRALDPRNGAWRATHPRHGMAAEKLSWRTLDEICRFADLVTVTTPKLAEVYAAGHGRVAIIPNHVPAAYLDVERPVNDVPVVGWCGAMASHPTDLQVTRGAVARAVRATGAQFGLVGGPAEQVRQRLGLADPPVLLAERLGLPQRPGVPGFVGLDDYPRAMAGIDVGIVPLADTAFNAAKSDLKLIEFAALGIPAVVSPTPPNIATAQRLGMPVARKPRDWEREVRRLVESPELRADLGGRAREIMRTETIEANAQLWWEAWEAAHARAGRLVLA